MARAGARGAAASRPCSSLSSDVLSSTICRHAHKTSVVCWALPHSRRYKGRAAAPLTCHVSVRVRAPRAESPSAAIPASP